MIQGPAFSYRIVAPSRRLRNTWEETSFDLVLLDQGGLPADALNAPLASWVIARLTAEAGLGGSYADASQASDGGAYSLDFEVTGDQGELVGRFELLGFTWCIELAGSCEKVSSTEVINDFAGLLLARPEHLGRCRVSVFDNEWKEHPEDYDPRWPTDNDRNIYGWNGTRFLGTTNFWNEAEVDHPWPGEDYRAYHDRSLAMYRDGGKTEKLGVIQGLEGLIDDPDDEDSTDDVVAEVRAELMDFFQTHPDCAVRLRVYDLDGGLVQDEQSTRETVQARVETWIGDGFNASWLKQDDVLWVKVWEYPASEPPWEAAIDGSCYEPEVRP